jgi:hypothetical protein
MKSDARRILNKFKTAFLVMGITLAGSPAQGKTSENTSEEGHQTEFFVNNESERQTGVKEISLDELVDMSNSREGQNVVSYSTPQEEYAYQNNLVRHERLSRGLPHNSIYEGAYLQRSYHYGVSDKIVYLPKDMELNRYEIRRFNYNNAVELYRECRDVYNPRGKFVYGPGSQYGYGPKGPSVGDVVHEVGRTAREINHVTREIDHTVKEVKRTVREIKGIFNGGKKAPAPRSGSRTGMPRGRRDR